MTESGISDVFATLWGAWPTALSDFQATRAGGGEKWALARENKAERAPGPISGAGWPGCVIWGGEQNRYAVGQRLYPWSFVDSMSPA